MWWVLPVYTLIVSGSALEEKCSPDCHSPLTHELKTRCHLCMLPNGLPAQLICFYLSPWHATTWPLSQHLAMSLLFQRGNPDVLLSISSFPLGSWHLWGELCRTPQKSANLPQLSLLQEPSLMWCSVGSDGPRGPFQPQPCCDLSWATTCHLLVLICLLTVWCISLSSPAFLSKSVALWAGFPFWTSAQWFDCLMSLMCGVAPIATELCIKVDSLPTLA